MCWYERQRLYPMEIHSWSPKDRYKKFVTEKETDAPSSMTCPVSQISSHHVPVSGLNEGHHLCARRCGGCWSYTDEHSRNGTTVIGVLGLLERRGRFFPPDSYRELWWQRTEISEGHSSHLLIVHRPQCCTHTHTHTYITYIYIYTHTYTYI